MEKQYSAKFFSGFIESLQRVSREHLTFDQIVEISGYISVEIDNARKERYVLSELLQSGNIISESYCTKVFKNLPIYPVKKSDSKKTEDSSTCEDKENTESSKPENNNSDGPSEPKRKRSLSSKSEDDRDSKRIPDGPSTKQADIVSPSSSTSIGSRSSSFLASSPAAKMSSLDGTARFEKDGFTRHALFKEDKVLTAVKSTRSSISTDDGLGGDEVDDLSSDTLSVPKSSKSSEASTSLSQSSHGKAIAKTVLTSNSQSGNKSRVKPTSPGASSLGSNPSLNFSSLRHMVSKSYECPKLKQRKAGMEEDLEPGEPYIELLEDVSDEGLNSTNDHMDEVPCTVSSSLTLESNYQSKDSITMNLSLRQDDEEAADSPVIIELDSDEADDDDDDEDDDDGDDDEENQMLIHQLSEHDLYSTSEKRKLDTFKEYVKFAVKRFQAFMKEKDLDEPMFRIKPIKLDPLLAEFYVTVRKRRGEEFGISTLKSIQSYLEQYLRENGYPFSITRDQEFSNCRSMLQAKIQLLRKRQSEVVPDTSTPVVSVTRRDVERLFRFGLLGDGSADSLTNSMWFMNTVLFKFEQNVEHYALRWGEIMVRVDEFQNEYLHHTKSDLQIYPNNANPDQCFIRLFKKFQSMRPPSMLALNSPFYLAVDKQLNMFQNEKMKFGVLGGLLKSMLVNAGIAADKQIVDFDIL